MKIINPYTEILTPLDGQAILQHIELCGRVCYKSEDKITDTSAAKFVAGIIKRGHEAVLEHFDITVKFVCDRGVSHEIVRHRMASYSVQSQRYVREGAFEFVLPPEIEKNERAKEIYLEAMARDQRDYDELAALLKRQHTERLLAEGMEQKAAEKAAEKLAIEDARFVLPNACHTKLIVTMNARSLLNFFSQRCCNRAQWEIRALATEMLRLVRREAPTVFAKAGPPCLRGACPEGKMSCGKAQQVRRAFEAL